MSCAAVVTGAGSGIGAAAARELARRGVAVAALDVDASGIRRTVADIRRADQRAIALVADVTHDDDIAEAVETAERELGPLNVVVSAAGREMAGTVTTLAVDDWRRALDVNLTGTFLTARHTVPRLIKNGGGAFTALSSDVGVHGSVGEIAYSAAKHGVVGLVRCLAPTMAGTASVPTLSVRALWPLQCRTGCSGRTLTNRAMNRGSQLASSLNLRRLRESSVICRSRPPTRTAWFISSTAALRPDSSAIGKRPGDLNRDVAGLESDRQLSCRD